MNAFVKIFMKGPIMFIKRKVILYVQVRGCFVRHKSPTLND